MKYITLFSGQGILSILYFLKIYRFFSTRPSGLPSYMVMQVNQLYKYADSTFFLTHYVDYICNWFGGEAVSLAANFSGAEEFRAAGYTPMIVDGVEYGVTREYSNFSFTRIYEAGHEVPYYQPLASLALFNRTINMFDVATGEIKITADYATNGTAEATHTQAFVPLPSSTTSAV